MEELIELLNQQDDEVYKSFARALKFIKKEEQKEDEQNGE